MKPFSLKLLTASLTFSSLAVIWRNAIRNLCTQLIEYLKLKFWRKPKHEFSYRFPCSWPNFNGLSRNIKFPTLIFRVRKAARTIKDGSRRFMHNHCVVFARLSFVPAYEIADARAPFRRGAKLDTACIVSIFSLYKRK